MAAHLCPICSPAPTSAIATLSGILAAIILFFVRKHSRRIVPLRRSGSFHRTISPVASLRKHCPTATPFLPLPQAPILSSVIPLRVLSLQRWPVPTSTTYHTVAYPAIRYPPRSNACCGNQ